MNGGVRKRGASWSYYFDLGQVDGKRKRKEKGGFRTKKEAEAALAAALTEYNTAGSVFEPSNITVADYLDQWYELYCKLNLKYNTQLSYLRIMENHLKPRFGPYRLRSLTPAVIQEYANDMKLNGFSKSHLKGILSVLRAALDYAIEPLHYIAQNPVRVIRPPRVDRKPRERIVLSMDEWHTIIDRFEDTRYFIPLMIGFYTGLRISETFALTWDDIDFERRALTVNKQVVKRNFGADVRKEIEKSRKKLPSSWYFTSTKSVSSVRTVPFGDTLYNALKAEHARQKRTELVCGERYTVHYLKKELDEKGDTMQRIISVPKLTEVPFPRVHLLCVDDTGQYTSTDSFKYCSRIIHHELQLAFDYHSLRHTHATLLIESGANVKNVQTRLGHNDIQTTLQTYVHDTENMARQSVDLFEKITSRKQA